LKRKIPNPEGVCFVIIPVNLEQIGHWSLAIIANLDGSLTEDDTMLSITTPEGDSTPCVLYLDSLMTIDSEIKDCLFRFCNLFKAFKNKLDAASPFEDVSYPWYSHRLNIPKQRNGFDCGIFLLEYAARFLYNPDSLINNSTKDVIYYPTEDELEDIVLRNQLCGIKDNDMEKVKHILLADLNSCLKKKLDINSIEFRK